MKNHNPEDIWIDKQEIFMRLHISNRTLQIWRTKGVIPFARIGKKIFYREADLRNLLNSNIRRNTNTGSTQTKFDDSS